ncbi:MAG: hypothetical protein ABIP94_01690, partial [Planctomycetota bacterium]
KSMKLQASRLRNFFALCLFALPVAAAQIDIQGPPGSTRFGENVTVLPNGNIVVLDPFGGGGVGRVHLYSPTGAFISTLAGSNTNDNIGSEGVVVLSNGNFVVVSPYWHNGGVINAGAVTWVDGTAGLSGAVSPANSLVGSAQDDTVGSAGSTVKSGVIALTNGNYVVASSNWNNGVTTGVGAVTWANGATGRSGAISPANSLIGSNFSDNVGFNGVTALTNGHYVVRSMLWRNGAAEGAGAVTWGNGTAGITGVVSPSNSLVGTVFNNLVGAGSIGVLSNGNYVVVSPSWSSATIFQAGAVTWANGATGRTGEVSASNSLIGSTENDRVGSPGVSVLTNGNYVVRSANWDSDSASNVGAVTWANGVTGLVGVVGPTNSLVGSTTDDLVGDGFFVNNRLNPGVVPLNNGNYVVLSSGWDNGATADAGAVTWANGETGRSGAVSISNSLFGPSAGDNVGGAGAWPLANGNFVVLSPSWRKGALQRVGAATWAPGNAGLVGPVSALNSLTGTTEGDNIGSDGLAALTNGHYVVLSPFWNNGANNDVGAVTWLNGNAGTSALVSSTNSLVGASPNDYVGITSVAVLTNGNYVVPSPNWDDAARADVGAVTWANGSTGLAGAVTAGNSLIGSTAGDAVGGFDSGAVAATVTAGLAGGNYAVVSDFWDNSALIDAGAITLGRGDAGTVGVINASNSVRGTAANDGQNLVFGYDPARAQIAVGRPASNIVSLFQLAVTEVIFANSFE